MKKMIFTAMAVLAFSAVSVANTIEVKEEVVVNNESKEVKTLASDCFTKAMNYIDKVYDPNGTKSPAEVEAAYQGYIKGCEDAKEKSLSAN